MRIKSFIVTLLGIAIAAGSVLIAKDYLGDPQGSASASAPAEMVNVVVARQDIDFGQPLSAPVLRLQPWPREAVPRGAFTDFSDIVAAGRENERRAVARIYEGEVVLRSKLSAPGERVTIVQKLGENTRAMAISVDAVTAVGGFVTPGDYVDVMLAQGGGDNMRVGTILQDIRVIGVDQKSEEDSDQPSVARTVTVEVTPDQGQRLALAQRVGTLSLTLRTLDARDDEPLDLVEMRDLFAMPEPETPEAAEAPRRAPTITIRRGIVTEEVDLR